MLKLKLQYFGHLMRRVDSLEKILMLGGIGGKRRRTEDEMAGWHHWLDGRESEWTSGVGDGQGGLACCGSGGRKESDTTEWLIWSDLIFLGPYYLEGMPHTFPPTGASANSGATCSVFRYDVSYVTGCIQQKPSENFLEQDLLLTGPRVYMACPRATSKVVRERVVGEGRDERERERKPGFRLYFYCSMRVAYPDSTGSLIVGQFAA